MDIIFSPIKLGKYKLNNRIGLAPISRLSNINDSLVQNGRQFLVTRAINGCSVITTEALAIKTYFPSALLHQPYFYSKKHVKEWLPIVTKIKQLGAFPIIQLNHSGRLSNDFTNSNSTTVVSSGTIKSLGIDRQTLKEYNKPRMMHQKDIDHLISSFVHSARMAIKAGFLGVELNCAHGYLLNQFLSSTVNERNDKYGGNISRRILLICEIIEKIREEIKNNALISLRLSYFNSNKDLLFQSNKEMEMAISDLSKTSLDIISLSTQEQSNTFLCNMEFTKRIRKYWDRYLFSAGGIYNYNTANTILRYADIAMVGKSLLLMPQWIELMKTNWPLKPFTRKDTRYIYGEKFII